jgi:hypothetical protein
MRASGQMPLQLPQLQAHQPTEVNYQAHLASIPSESSLMTSKYFTSTKQMPLDNRTQVDQGSTFQAMAQPPQLIPGHQQPQQSQRQALVQGQRKSTLLQSGQLFSTAVGPPILPSTAQSANESSISSMGAQINTSGGGAQNQGRAMIVPMNPASVNSVSSSSVIPQSAGPMQIWKPTVEEVMTAKRWVDEQKKVAFSRG